MINNFPLPLRCINSEYFHLQALVHLKVFMVNLNALLLLNFHIALRLNSFNNDQLRCITETSEKFYTSQKKCMLIINLPPLQQLPKCDRIFNSCILIKSAII